MILSAIGWAPDKSRWSPVNVIPLYGISISIHHAEKEIIN